MKKQLLIPGKEFKVTSASNLVLVTYAVTAKLCFKDFFQLYKEYRILHKRYRLVNEVTEFCRRLAEFENHETPSN